MPKALENMPEPDELLQKYINAFILLSDTRRSMEVISLSDMFLYADTIGDDRLEFAKIISEGDKAYLKAKAEKQELNEKVVNNGNQEPSRN